MVAVQGLQPWLEERMAFQAERAESPWVSRLGSPGPWGFHLDVRSLPRLRMEGSRHCSQVSSPQPHTRDSSLRGLAPVAPSPARFIPKGFQPIAGGERSVTTGHRLPTPAYPEGIAALRVVDSLASAGIPSGYGSLVEHEPVVFAALDHRLWAATPAGWKSGPNPEDSA